MTKIWSPGQRRARPEATAGVSRSKMQSVSDSGMTTFLYSMTCALRTCSTTCIPDWTIETNSSDPAVLQPRHILLSQLCLVAPEPLPHHATTANYESLCLPAGRTITPFRPQESASYTGLFQAMCPSWKPGLKTPSVSCEYVSNRNAEKRLLSSPRARCSTANKDLTASKATQPCGLFLTSHDAHDL